MFGYVVDIYREGSISERQDSSTGRLSDAETAVYEGVRVELQPKNVVLERDGVKVVGTTMMFCGRPLEILTDDIVIDTDSGDRYKVIENRSIAVSHQWLLRRVS